MLPSPGLIINMAPRSTCRYEGDLPLMSSAGAGWRKGKGGEGGKRWL